MLDLMRQNSNSWATGLLFAVIIFVFAINFGPWAGNLQGELKYAAEVNGHVITFQEYQMAYAAQIRSIQALQPDFNPDDSPEQILKTLVLDHLIAKTLLAQTAKNQGFVVTDTQLAHFIRTHIFDKAQKMDRETYRRAIYSSYHMSENQFESQLRQDLASEQLSQLIQSTVQSERGAAFLDEYVAFLRKKASVKI
ncbi:MAG: SurA N-terminal domain-containing protein [Myxococcaceae bacterium]|nr:SurA N-terminal domain-containing protein [Myxococcaceae bacterium]MBH2006511.1 SurA N-terminal domain-containing protein [Myxococcaceae bacterium]